MSTFWPSHHQDDSLHLLHDSNFPANLENLFLSIYHMHDIKPIHYIGHICITYKGLHYSFDPPNNFEMYKEQVYSFSLPLLPSLSLPTPNPPPFLQMRKQHSNLNGLVESTGAMSGTQVLLSSASGALPSHCNAWGPFWSPILHCTPSLAPNCLHSQAPSFRSPRA